MEGRTDSPKTHSKSGVAIKRKLHSLAWIVLEIVSDVFLLHSLSLPNSVATWGALSRGVHPWINPRFGFIPLLKT